MQGESSLYDFAMGTAFSITLYKHGQYKVLDEIFTNIKTIENLMSVNIPSSDVSRINAAAGIEAVHVNEKTFKVIERAIYFAYLSGGAFDPSIGALTSLWGIGNDNRNDSRNDYHRIPLQDDIDKILSLVNWRNIVLDSENNTVFLTQEGMALDLGAITKGYTVDRTVDIIRNAGIKRAKIDIGGEIYMLGEKTDKTPWRVGIQDPKGVHGGIIGFIQTGETSVVTSGIYERFFEKDGIHYHHILNPFNGYPADNELLSVTLTASSAMDADALSTAIFVLGYENAGFLFETQPGIAAIFVFKDLNIKMSGDIDFTLTNKAFNSAMQE